MLRIVIPSRHKAHDLGLMPRSLVGPSIAGDDHDVILVYDHPAPAPLVDASAPLVDASAPLRDEAVAGVLATGQVPAGARAA